MNRRFSLRPPSKQRTVSAEEPGVAERVMNAFESILVEAGERAATLEAVAKIAGVSKGGLLHYYPNREDLVSAQLERFDELVREDIRTMKAAAGGAVMHFLQTSLWSSSPLDKAFVAVNRLAPIAPAETQRRLADVQKQWLEVLEAEVGPELALAIRYIGDGLFFNAVFHHGEPGNQHRRETDVADLVSLLRNVRGS
ncbi:TetR/AcrR family transcriptional regulator [Arthrobacter sp. S39]|uniref:TetR/AcrR family transcriptional regulator n=1 Tax=Arthrobacter sp. S39 TaxID=2509720 RepID=UPI0010379865|nr:TetR/AcrR family transcriptional regulator [Arthrobacter sp. S39]TAP42805.1 TetR/AcrR family transcriptional regulator [Arthrobacter sp. S39]